MSTIFPHTVNETKVDYNLIPVGTLLLGFNSRNITTKTYKNTSIIVGDSKRNLKDFINYYSYKDGSILKFYKGQLTTITPNIYLQDISGVFISGNGDYLAVNNASNLINVYRKEYSLSELSDVSDSIPTNKYALTYTGSHWEYKPEASALSKFEDVTYFATSYGVFVSYFAPVNVGGFGNSYRVLPLSISWDGTPTLGNNLNCNSKSIKNLFYITQNFEAISPVTSFSLDTIRYSESNIVCNDNVKVLDLDIVVNSEHLKFYTLNINNFNGIINFKSQASIAFENGYIPKINKLANTYTLLIYKDNVKIKIIILYKNRNMEVFTNGQQY